MRVVFMCASEYGLQCLKEVYCLKGIEIYGVVTTPKEFTLKWEKGNKSKKMVNGVYEEIEEFTLNNGISHYVMDKMNDALTISTLKQWKPELIVVVGWYHIIGQEILDIPSQGIIGLHASLLPKYRGGAPLVWQIINGENYAGITMFYFDIGIDNGDIIAQEEVQIEETDTIKSLYEKVGMKGIELLLKYIPMIKQGRAPRIQQECLDDDDIWPQRTPEDGIIDWSKSAKEIMNFVRAQTRPYPGAYTVIDNKKVTIWDCTVEEIV